MPFATSRFPSLQLGILKATAAMRGIDVDTFHFNLDLAAIMGRLPYEDVSAQRGTLLGEWLFSREAFGANAPDPDGKKFLKQYRPQLSQLGHLRARKQGDVAPFLRRLRDQVIPTYLRQVVENVDWTKYLVVGFTSTFQQHVASLALSARIKAVNPRIKTVFGGANLDGMMGAGHMRAEPSIDYVVIGDGERAWASLLEQLRAGKTPSGIGGLLTRDKPQAWRVVVGNSAPLSGYAHPDFGEYYQRSFRLGLLRASDRKRVPLPFESSRGCWWGSRGGCLFCGLNGSTIKYRRKKWSEVLREIDSQSRKYGSRQFEATDNVVPMDYFDTLFRALAVGKRRYRITYEVRATLTKRQVESMAEAGVDTIQIGIESMSSKVLQMMNKGTTLLDNVNVLRWCRHYGVDARYNILWGIPGEDRRDYRSQDVTLRKMFHLQPPVGFFRVWMERFSRLFEQRGSHSFRYVRPHGGYSMTYPEGIDLEEIAYFFDYDSLREAKGYGFMRDTINAWQEVWRRKDRPFLEMMHVNERVTIRDSRNPRRGCVKVIDGDAAKLLLLCSEGPTAMQDIVQKIGRRAPQEVDRMVQSLERQGLLLTENGQVLSLPLPSST